MLQLNAARVAFETVDIPDYTTRLLLLLNTIQNSYSVNITNHNKNKRLANQLKLTKNKLQEHNLLLSSTWPGGIALNIHTGQAKTMHFILLGLKLIPREKIKLHLKTKKCTEMIPSLKMVALGKFLSIIFKTGSSITTPFSIKRADNFAGDNFPRSRLISYNLEMLVWIKMTGS